MSKIYHGTSFENACNIFNECKLGLGIGSSFEGYVRVRAQMETPPKMLDIDTFIEQYNRTNGVHCTTNKNTAIQYASLHHRPVVLIITVDEPRFSCDDFILPSVDEFDKNIDIFFDVKCLDLVIIPECAKDPNYAISTNSPLIFNYGALCNLLYSK